MGKKKNNTTLGRSLIKDKFSGRRRRKGDEEFGSLVNCLWLLYSLIMSFYRVVLMVVGFYRDIRAK